MAAHAGVRVPEVVIAARGQGGYAGVVTRQADVDPLEGDRLDQIGDGTLVELWRQVATLRAAGISHGRLNASRVILDQAGQPVIVGFAAATLGAPQPALDIDVAGLLVSTTVLVGPNRALSAAVCGAGVDAVQGSLPYLQRAALRPTHATSPGPTRWHSTSCARRRRRPREPCRSDRPDDPDPATQPAVHRRHRCLGLPAHQAVGRCRLQELGDVLEMRSRRGSSPGSW